MTDSPSATLSAPSDEGRKTENDDVLGLDGTAGDASERIPPTTIDTVDIYRIHSSASETSKAEASEHVNHRQEAKATAITFDARRFQQLAKTRRSLSLEGQPSDCLPGFSLRITTEDQMELESPARMSNANAVKRLTERRRTWSCQGTAPVFMKPTTPKTSCRVASSAANQLVNDNVLFSTDTLPAVEASSSEPKVQPVSPMTVTDAGAQESPNHAPINQQHLDAPVAFPNKLDHKRWRQLQINFVRLGDYKGKDEDENQTKSASEEVQENSQIMALKKKASKTTLKALADLGRTVSTSMQNDPFALRSPSSCLQVSNANLSPKGLTINHLTKPHDAGPFPWPRNNSDGDESRIDAVTSLYYAAKSDVRLDRAASLHDSSTLSTWELMSIDDAAGYEFEAETGSIVTRIFHQVRVIVCRCAQVLVFLFVVWVSWIYLSGEKKLPQTPSLSTAKEYVAEFYSNSASKVDTISWDDATVLARQGLDTLRRGTGFIRVTERPVVYIYSRSTVLYASAVDALLTLLIYAAEIGSRSASYFVHLVYQIHLPQIIDNDHSSIQKRRVENPRSNTLKRQGSRRATPRPTKETAMSWRPTAAESKATMAPLLNEEAPKSECTGHVTSCSAKEVSNSAQPQPNLADGIANKPISLSNDTTPTNNMPHKERPATSPAPRPPFVINPALLGDVDAGRKLFIQPETLDMCFRPSIDLVNLPHLYKDETPEAEDDIKGFFQGLAQRWKSLVESIMQDEDLFI